jgi:hypothetical protein
MTGGRRAHMRIGWQLLYLVVHRRRGSQGGDEHECPSRPNGGRPSRTGCFMPNHTRATGSRRPRGIPQVLDPALGFLSLHLGHVRRKLSEVGVDDVIETIRGRG